MNDFEDSRAGARLAELMRMARQGRGWSQLQLSFEIDVSQRHVSFVETGRSKPSRRLIEEWMAAAAAPVELRDAALQLAGFVSTDAFALPDNVAMVTDSLRHLLAAESDLPIAVFDDQWHLLGTNAAAEWLGPSIMQGYWHKQDRNCARLDMLDAVADSGGLLATAPNRIETAASLIKQVVRESWTNGAIAPRAQAMRESLVSRLGTAVLDESAGTGTRRFVFEVKLGRLSFFPVQSVCSQPGGARLRMEQWVPADATTQRALSMRRQDFASLAPVAT